MSQRTILRVIGAAFLLIVLLVLAAAWLGHQGSQSIHDNARELVRRHLIQSGPAADLEARIEAESEALLNELQWILGLCFLLAAGCASLTFWFTRRTLRRLDWQTEELSRVSWTMLEDQERVARRFSHELHDELGQSLTGLKGMAKRWTPDQFAAGRKEFVEVVDGVLRDVRELSQLLRPVILDDFGLDAGLRWLADRFTQRTQIEISYSSLCARRLPGSLETHLFRITQEALTNIARHSGGTQALVELTDLGDRVRLRIEDNGRGIDPDTDEKAPSIGMVGMRARTRYLRGSIELSNLPTGGLRILIEAPIQVVQADGDTVEL
jgi:signal transduction histidine kinase